jgi:hypothetical protein
VCGGSDSGSHKTSSGVRLLPGPPPKQLAEIPYIFVGAKSLRDLTGGIVIAALASLMHGVKMHLQRHSILLAITIGIISLFVVACSAAVSPPRDVHRAVVIGRGQTAAGKSFIAMVGMGRLAARYRRSKFAAELKPSGGCSLPVFVKEDNSKWSYEVCYSRSEVSQQIGIQCEEGQRLIHIAAPASTRKINLRLSNGRQVVSGVMFLPRRLGGPLALYYQSLPGGAPAPVAATELANDGRVLATIPASTTDECTKTLARQLPGGPTVVKANAPSGEAFTIATERTRILGKIYVGLRLVFSGGMIAESAALRVIHSLYWNVSRVCGSRPYGVLYGILGKSHDEALVRVGGHVMSMHAGPSVSGGPSKGVVVYKVLTRPPERLIVRASSGHILEEADISSTYSETPCAK